MSRYYVSVLSCFEGQGVTLMAWLNAAPAQMFELPQLYRRRWMKSPSLRQKMAKGMSLGMLQQGNETVDVPNCVNHQTHNKAIPQLIRTNSLSSEDFLSEILAHRRSSLLNRKRRRELNNVRKVGMVVDSSSGCWVFPWEFWLTKTW